ARLILEVPAARAAMILAVVHVARPRPPIEQARSSSLERRPCGLGWTLAGLLWRDDQRATVDERLIEQLRPLARRILAHPVVVRRTPELPVVLLERCATQRQRRHAAVLLDPRIRQIAERREVDNELRLSHRR